MKKILFICFAITCFISSCKKDVVEAPVKETESQNSAEGLMYWNDLPDEYKNAEIIASHQAENNMSKRNAHDADESFDPFGIGANYGFYFKVPADKRIVTIGIGRDASGWMTGLVIWYKMPGKSVTYMSIAGDFLNAALSIHSLTAGEYIKSFSGYSSYNRLRYVAFHTNKGVIVGGGTSTSGTRFSYSVTPGSYIGAFSGKLSTDGKRIDQLRVLSCFSPWEKVSSSNAIDIASDTSGAYMVNESGLLYKMSKTETSWSWVANAPVGIIRVAAYDGGYLCVITLSGRVYNCDRFTHAWTQRPSIVGPRDIVINGLGQIFVATSSGIYHHNNATASSWTLYKSGNYKRVSCGSVSNIRAIDNNGNIFSIGTYGEQMPGSNGQDIHSSFDGQTWLTNSSGKVSFVYYPNITQWKEISGADAVSITATKGKVMMVNAVGDIYKLEY